MLVWGGDSVEEWREGGKVERKRWRREEERMGRGMKRWKEKICW